MCRHSQKGSALLIVLGFLSFMVVSAVAFAIWMRNERLPSSALRRSVANRYLVKAALAQAMSRVDDAIRSHAFPGVWNTNQQASVYRDKNGWAYDWWESRVFMPPNPEGMVDDQSNNSGNRVSPDNNRFLRYAPVTKTVSVLNLEALGYLPPSIINDVRLLARSSWAAQWDYFNFDAGRYAFCAVNVSDMLDINKIAADRSRTSAAAVYPQEIGQPPPSRFSLAYLFRNGDNPADPNGHDEFDKRVHTQRREPRDAPFVSMMDYHLAAGYSSMGNIYTSPYFQYVNGDNSSKYFYQENNKDGSHVKSAERQPFVTSSWFPSAESVKVIGSKPSEYDKAKKYPIAEVVDLALDQPFDSARLKKDLANLDDALLDVDTPFWQTMKNGQVFCQLDQCTLFDYLDEDDVPISLAVPCAERVPMITALAPVSGGTINLFPPDPTTPDEVTPVVDNEYRKYFDTKISIAGGMGMTAIVLFPFKEDGRPRKSFKAQAFARLVFVDEGASGGATSSSVGLRNTGFARVFRPMNSGPEDDGEWTKEVKLNDQFKINSGRVPNALERDSINDSLVVTLSGPEVSLPDYANVRNVEDCWKKVLLPMNSTPELEGEDRKTLPTIIRKVEIWEKKPSPDGDSSEAPEKLKETKYEIALRPFNTEGSIDFPKGEIDESTFDGLCKHTIRPYLVTWVRVKQGSKTVDMVPAMYADDLAFNGVDNVLEDHYTNFDGPLGNCKINSPAEPTTTTGGKLPIMRFPGTMFFTYADAISSTKISKPIDWEAKSCYALDPRYNWAPENWWFDASDGSPDGLKWYDAVFKDGGILDKLVEYEFDGSVPGRGDRASDPFLFVSNLGYLQSVGELAFLPRLSDMWEAGVPNVDLGVKDKKNPSAPDVGDLVGNFYNGNPRGLTSVATMPCALVAWKSYQSYRTNREGIEFGANLYRRGLINGSQGFYVNPFTQSHEVMLAALANTPLNYWVAAATNTTEKTMPTKFGDPNYKGYLFSEGSSMGVDVKGKDISRVATFLQHRFQDLMSMLTPPANATDRDIIYAYQKAWEDLYDILDWSGKLGEKSSYTIQMAYDHLRDYYQSGDAGTFYRGRYTKENDYSGLNKYAKGQGRGLNVKFTLDPEKAIYKNELGYSADPLQAEGDYEDGKKKSTEFYGDLYDIDRMFLHSYWRDCFANRQQLFLIFVRAESTALGGTGEGTPAQQGGRAVALVWRDPEPPTGQNVDEKEEVINIQTGGKYDRRSERHPHKMRVLFYRQLD